MTREHRGKIYLSGGMEKAVNLGAAWRTVCSNRLLDMDYRPIDITALDVLYTEVHGPVMTTDPTANPLQNKSNIRHQFIYTDMRLIIDDADAVIAYYDQSFKDGAGSFAECQCTYDNEKPLFIVSEFQHVPSWLKALSTRIFYQNGTDAGFQELYAYLKELPHGILKDDRYGNHSSGNYYLCSLCGDVFLKSKHHYVSKVSRPYCLPCVDVVATTREKHADRYDFISKVLGE